MCVSVAAGDYKMGMADWQPRRRQLLLMAYIHHLHWDCLGWLLHHHDYRNHSLSSGRSRKSGSEFLESRRWLAVANYKRFQLKTISKFFFASLEPHTHARVWRAIETARVRVPCAHVCVCVCVCICVYTCVLRHTRGRIDQVALPSGLPGSKYLAIRVRLLAGCKGSRALIYPRRRLRRLCYFADGLTETAAGTISEEKMTASSARYTHAHTYTHTYTYTHTCVHGWFFVSFFFLRLTDELWISAPEPDAPVGSGALRHAWIRFLPSGLDTSGCSFGVVKV